MGDFQGTGIHISDETIAQVFMARRYSFETQKQEWYLTDVGKLFAELVSMYLAAAPERKKLL